MAKYFENAHKGACPIMNYFLKILLNASSYPCAPKFKIDEGPLLCNQY